MLDKDTMETIMKPHPRTEDMSPIQRKLRTYKVDFIREAKSYKNVLEDFGMDKNTLIEDLKEAGVI